MKISVVTAVYNAESTIADTIESLLGQSWTDWQHIIVDGGSTDRTLAIIQQYDSRYNGRLKLISEPDEGIYDAMNKGISNAEGDVIGFLNSDDFFTRSNVLQRIVDAWTQRPAIEGVYGDIMYVEADNTSRVVRYYSSHGFRRWKMLLGLMPAHPSFYCRRDLYERHGSFDTTFHVAADFENLLRIIYRGRAAVNYLPMNFVTMRVGGASTSGLASHRAIIRDHRRAMIKNSIRVGVVTDFLRYPLKIAELVSFRLHSHRN